jgi:predicted DNA-binding transcriptional regulator AlpA
MDAVRSDGNAPGLKKLGPDAPCLPRLLLWKKDVAQMLGISGRTLERMISAGEIPSPDRRLRRRPAWLAATIQEWAVSGCPGIGRNLP